MKDTNGRTTAQTHGLTGFFGNNSADGVSGLIKLTMLIDSIYT